MSMREELARATLLNEMVAEGLVSYSEDAVVMLNAGNGEYMVEVKVLEVTGHAGPIRTTSMDVPATDK